VFQVKKLVAMGRERRSIFGGLFGGTTARLMTKDTGVTFK